jgi:hypothetical protein
MKVLKRAAGRLVLKRSVEYDAQTLKDFTCALLDIASAFIDNADDIDNHPTFGSFAQAVKDQINGGGS